MRWTAAICALVLLAAPTLPAAAQGVLTGRITTDSTNQPVAEAEVLIAALEMKTVSDAGGRYRLAGIPLGTHVLEIRRIGFTPTRLTIELEDDEPVQLDIALVQAAFELPTLTTEAARIRSARLAELEHRQRTGGARHITAEDLAARKGNSVADILRTRGVNIAYDPYKFLALPMGRGNPNIIRGTNSCIMHVLVDGAEIPTDFLNLNSHSVEQYAAIEIYQRAAEVPIEFTKTGFNCGAILLWSSTTLGK